MAIRILTDSAADYEPQELAEKHIAMVPIGIAFGDESFQDGYDLSKEEFYKRLLTREHFPKTAQPSPNEFLTHFEAAKEAGDQLIAILLSSGLSGTYHSACLAQEMCEYDGIFVIDSLSAVTGMRLMVDTALLRVAEGKSAEEIVAEVIDMRSRMTIYAGMDTLEYLRMGGRISKTQASLAGALNVKPILSVNPVDGTLDVPNKALGMKRAMGILMDYMKKIPRDPTYPVYFPFSLSPENVKSFIALAKQQYPDIDETLYFNLGPTIGSHIGDNAFGFTYVRAK